MDKEHFYRKFQADVAGIQDRIGQLKSVAAAQRKHASDGILASLSQLSLQVADAAEFIPAYDQRTYSNTVKSFTDQLNDELARLAPAKPRFQFKKTAKPAATTATATAAEAAAPAKADHRLLRGVPDAKAVAEPSSTASTATVVATKDYNTEIASPSPSSPIRRPSFSHANEINISGHSGLHIVLPPSAAAATASGSLTDLVGCVVDMSAPTAAAPFQSLMLRNIQRSLVVVGRVSGPVHMTGLRSCVLVVAARQVRIHECRNVDVYLDVRSRPIIEDCTGMRFAPVPQTFHEESASANQWDQVDDFKWLRAEPSPNWSVLPEEDRLSDSVWAGGGEEEATDILRRVGLHQ